MSLQVEVSGLRILAEVVAWAAARSPRARIADVVVQDEFTHDVIVEAPPEWLVFDAT